MRGSRLPVFPGCRVLMVKWALAMLLLTAIPALAQKDLTARQYDRSGRQTGRAESRDDTTRYYDPSGRQTGRAESRNGTT